MEVCARVARRGHARLFRQLHQLQVGLSFRCQELRDSGESQPVLSTTWEFQHTTAKPYAGGIPARELRCTYWQQPYVHCTLTSLPQEDRVTLTRS